MSKPGTLTAAERRFIEALARLIARRRRQKAAADRVRLPPTRPTA